MYEISDYLRKEIKKEGGAESFAKKYDLSHMAIKRYYEEGKKMQLNTLISLAVLLNHSKIPYSESQWLLNLCKLLVQDEQKLIEDWGSQL